MPREPRATPLQRPQFHPHYGTEKPFAQGLKINILARLSSFQVRRPRTFTITAIPEPSTYLAALGLLALMLWPLRRRLRGKVS